MDRLSGLLGRLLRFGLGFNLFRNFQIGLELFLGLLGLGLELARKIEKLFRRALRRLGPDAILRVHTVNRGITRNLEMLHRLGRLLSVDLDKRHIALGRRLLLCGHHILALRAPITRKEDNHRSVLALQEILRRAIGANVLHSARSRHKGRNIIRRKDNRVKALFQVVHIQALGLALLLGVKGPCRLNAEGNLERQDNDPKDENVRHPFKQSADPRILFFDDLFCFFDNFSDRFDDSGFCGHLYVLCPAANENKTQWIRILGDRLPGLSCTRARCMPTLNRNAKIGLSLWKNF